MAIEQLLAKSTGGVSQKIAAIEMQSGALKRLLAAYQEYKVAPAIKAQHLPARSSFPPLSDHAAGN